MPISPRASTWRMLEASFHRHLEHHRRSRTPSSLQSLGGGVSFVHSEVPRRVPIEPSWSVVKRSFTTRFLGLPLLPNGT